MTGSEAKFVNLREKEVFSPKFASQAGKILKKKIHPAGGSETKVFLTSA